MLYTTITPEYCEIKAIDSLSDEMMLMADAIKEEFEGTPPTHALVGSNGTVYAYATDFETLEALKAGMKAFFDAFEDTHEQAKKSGQ